jgi:hypothetical protein
MFITSCGKTHSLFWQRRVEQIIGREAETAILLSRGFVTLCLRVAGFAPRHLNR